MSYDLIYFLIPTIKRVNANVFYNLYLFQKQNFNKVFRIYLALTLHVYMEHLIFFKLIVQFKYSDFFRFRFNFNC